MAMIASKCPDIRVEVVDLNQQRIDAWNSDNLPVYEPGLDEVVKSARGRNLFFTTGFRTQSVPILFLSVGHADENLGVGATRRRCASSRRSRMIAEVVDGPRSSSRRHSCGTAGSSDNSQCER